RSHPAVLLLNPRWVGEARRVLPKTPGRRPAGGRPGPSGFRGQGGGGRLRWQLGGWPARRLGEGIAVQSNDPRIQGPPNEGHEIQDRLPPFRSSGLLQPRTGRQSTLPPYRYWTWLLALFLASGLQAAERPGA